MLNSDSFLIIFLSPFLSKTEIKAFLILILSLICQLSYYLQFYPNQVELSSHLYHNKFIVDNLLILLKALKLTFLKYFDLIYFAINL